jgi:hypothetical protein
MMRLTPAFIFVPQISRGVRAQPEGGSAPLPPTRSTKAQP